jgi:hypothetical protein
VTGTVTFEQLAWIVGIITLAGGAVAGFLFWVWRIVEGQRRELKERDTAAQLEKERAKLIEQELRKEISDFRIHAAQTFATKDGVTAAVGRMEQAIEKLSSLVHESVERITARMDRILDSRGEQRRE